ncbi:alpha/beta hydrolase [Albimonas pacifica]|uniref:Acetyl esterase/lipase n=1 Tax=Albimonas pacifica TaxID=1114924 RepID=A0A1I3EK63_9RHOB|nr:alpha/beta hydrolase [Albimonas pacifica]SFH99366.1 Acetyl esterase/lipase [Albimonas pacifica]
MKLHLIATAFSVLAASGSVGAAQDSQPLWAQAPTTISPDWSAFFAEKGKNRDQTVPAPDDVDGWTTVRTAAGAQNAAAAEVLAAGLGITFRDTEIGGVPVVEIIPADPVGDDRIGVYTHGGAYVLGVAKTPQAVLFAAATGLKVISIEYTLAPHAQWDQATGEVVSVFAALAEAGVGGRDIVLAGDSAGGGLAAGSVLRMRDEGLEMPAALVLWSPWADVTETGDTYRTLRDAEANYTYRAVLGPSAIAYADEADQRNPYVSPVYGDFAAGFPPTLIQGGGTRELFVSDFIRLYQALDQSGRTVKLDLYEGMPHVFIAQRPASPEAKAAFAKTGAWVDQHLLRK